MPVIVDADRVRGARRAIEGGADLLLLDDGFQHRRIGRDADVVLVDARDPFAGGGLLPGGRLREPPASLRRADVVVLTRVGRATDEERRAARAAVAATGTRADVFEEDHRPVELVDAAGARAAGVEALRGGRFLVFSGIADPATLAESVSALGGEPVRVLDYGDHHEFTPEEVAALATEAEGLGVAAAITTEKDLTRIHEWPGRTALRALRIEASILADEERFRAWVLR